VAQSKSKKDVVWGLFEWSSEKELLNVSKHKLDFKDGAVTFLDPDRLIIEDIEHSNSEDRFYCIGRTPKGILTARFTPRGNKIRIIGVGAWRKGKAIYEEKNKK